MDNYREWQKEAITKCCKYFHEGNRVFMIDAAPGAGKTVCAAGIAKVLFETGHIERVISIAPLREVVRQWSEEFQNITGRHMIKITGSDKDICEFDMDLCATWSSLENLLDALQLICKKFKTLILNFFIHISINNNIISTIYVLIFIVTVRRVTYKSCWL